MLLELKDIRKEYRRGGREFSAVDGVSLTVNENDFILVTGRSGSGKSTLLKLIAGLIRPSSGAIVFNGRDLTCADEDDLALLRNTEIGYIPQEHSLLSNFTVRDNIVLPFYFYRRGGSPDERAEYLLEQTGIAHFAQSYPAQLSGGEQRRVSIARSLINEPKLIVADEPTGDLDPQTTEEILGLFSRVSQTGATVILVTHDTDAEGRSNRNLVMESGRLRRHEDAQPQADLSSGT
jgi:putative ABC transport system ATP-binding protein